MMIRKIVNMLIINRLSIHRTFAKNNIPEIYMKLMLKMLIMFLYFLLMLDDDKTHDESVCLDRLSFAVCML